MTSEGASSGASPRDSASPPIVRDGTSLPTTASFQVTMPESFTFSRPEEWVKWIRRFRVLFMNFITFRKKASGGMVFDARKENSGFMKVHYNNKKALK